MKKYKNKFFKQIGLENTCIENLLYKMQKDKRANKWKKQRDKWGGWDERCSWNLNFFMVEQIYTWLRIYFKKADDFVDLSFYEFYINGDKLTQHECILRAISDIEFWFFNFDPDTTDVKEAEELAAQAQSKIEEAFKIISIILPALWW